ncbi:MAG: Hpt domain-containing protein [bacterium]
MKKQQIESSEPAETIPGPVEMDELFRIMDGDMALLKECFDDFARYSAKLLANIKNAIDAGDAKDLKITAHKFRGTLINLAANKGAELASQLETMGKNANLAHADERFQSLNAECERLKDFMGKYCNNLAEIRLMNS